MRLKESQLRKLTRNIISELFTKKNPFSPEETLSDKSSVWGDEYDEFGGMGFDDGFYEGDESDLEELHEDEEEVE